MSCVAGLVVVPAAGRYHNSTRGATTLVASSSTANVLLHPHGLHWHVGRGPFVKQYHRKVDGAAGRRVSAGEQAGTERQAGSCRALQLGSHLQRSRKQMLQADVPRGATAEAK